MSKSKAPAPPGQPTHGSKIRVVGTETGSPAYTAVLSQVAGRLGQFQRKHQQQVQLSGQRFYKASADWEDAHVTYLNNEGQETITIEPRVSSGEEGEKPPVEAPWEFALVDFVFEDSTGKGEIVLSAFMSKPLTAEQKAMTDETMMPVQGITAINWQVADKPILEFADQNVVDADIIFEADDGGDNMTRSLRIDLRQFPHGLEVDIYGFVWEYTLQGGSGIDDGIVGTAISSTHVASVTKDYRSFDGVGWSPGGLSAAIGRLFINSSYSTSDDYDAIVGAFPELTATAYEVLGDGHGDRVISAAFHSIGSPPSQTWINDDLAGAGFQDYLGDRPSSVSPDDDPNAWALFAAVTAWDPGTQTYDDLIDLAGTTTEWAPGVTKTRSLTCTVMQDGSGTVSSVPTSGTLSGICDVANYNQIQYWLPTWVYRGPKAFTVKAVCARNGNPWRALSVHHNDSFYNETWQFEVPSTFPERPRMKEIGTGSLPYGDGGTGDDLILPARHFASTKVGTLKIDSRTGSMKFEAV